MIIIKVFFHFRYCTPGFVCAMKSYLWNTEHISESRTLVDIEDIFDGHRKQLRD